MKAIRFLEKKILNDAALQAQLKRWRLANKKISFTNGCFDVVHAGHIHTLMQAATFADVLIVGINSDASTRGLKGEGRPINNEADRALLLACLTMVDAVILFDDPTPIELIKKIMPDVLIKGGDYSTGTIVGANEVTANGGKVEIVPLIPGLSTTLLAQKISKL